MSISDGYVTMQDGVRLYFQKLGDGATALVIINGLYLFDDFKDIVSGRTVISLDLRHRGRSEFVSDASKLQRGIQQDVDDLETVRRHFDLDQIDLLAHSYAGMMVVLYAAKYPSHVRRIVQIGSVAPDQSKQYPPELMNADATLFNFFGRIQELEKQRAASDPVAFCKKFWSELRTIYVADPLQASKLDWEHCDLPTERNAMKYWMESIQPSLQAVKLTAEDLSQTKAEFLIVHGKKDRSAPYGGAVDWAAMLPNARLLTVEDAAHAPWIEAPEQVMPAIRTFLER